MPCPICDKPPESQYRPFCSRRCADIDLGRWLKGSYTFVAEESAAEPDAGAPERRDRP
ncbi:MAG: DNA gyrase inhibitor YacG [Pseudomonadota bacterium]